MSAVKKYVRFYVQSRKRWADEKPKPRPVVFSFAYQGKILCSLTGIAVLAADWDNKRQRVKTTVKRSNEVNTYLNNLESKINDIYFDALNKEVTIDNQYILHKLKNKPERKERKFEQVYMTDEWAKYLDIHEVKFKPSTIKGMRAVLDKFKRFCKKKKINPSFDDINTPLLSDYVRYLLEIGNTNNTIHSAIKRMKIFMSYALKAGKHNNNQYNRYNLSEKVGRIKFLEWHEVKKLIDLKIDDPFRNDVRNLFLFSCLSALRNSDVANLKKEDIKSHTFEGEETIFHALHIRQKKTDHIQTIPLLDAAYDILMQYKDTKGDLALPKIRLGLINEHIKDIAKEAGLTEKIPIDIYRGEKRETEYKEKWEILTSHMGRRTFISVAAAKGIPMHMVAEIAGQNPKTTMRHYAGIIDKEKFKRIVNDMKFDEKKDKE
jgi:site-specific recombinase XerD